MPTPTLGSYNSKPTSSNSYCYIQGDLTGPTAPILELASSDAGREAGPLSLAAEPVLSPCGVAASLLATWFT